MIGRRVGIKRPLLFPFTASWRRPAGPALRTLLSSSAHYGGEAGGAPQSDARIYRLALTGGPCGGKSSALARINQRLTSLGFDVYCVPEAATIFGTAGLNWGAITPEEAWVAQKELFRTQMRLEDSFVNISRLNEKKSTVLLCDRGLMDGSAYMPQGKFEEMVNKVGEDVGDIKYGRYDAVIHMVTAAIGAEKYYTLENNEARHESREQAGQLDRRLRDAYVGVNSHFIIPNREEWSFDDKVNSAVDRVCQIVGVPVQGIRKYFSLKSVPERLPIPEQQFVVDYTYLQKASCDEDSANSSSVGPRSRVQKRTEIPPQSSLESALRVAAAQPLNISYSLREEEEYHGFQNLTTSSRIISKKEYQILKTKPMDHTVETRRWRRVFMHEEYIFEIDLVLGPKGLDHVKLAVECENLNSKVDFPPFLEVGDEVTNDERYSSWHLAISRGKDS